MSMLLSLLAFGVATSLIPAENRLPVSWSSTVESIAAPTGVAVHPDGRILVVERHRHRVLVLNRNGSLLETWDEAGIPSEQWYRPHGIATSSDGRVAVTDAGNHRVRILAADGSYQQEVSAYDDTPLAQPADVDLSPTMTVIADTGNHRIVAVDRDGQPRWQLTEAAGRPLRGPRGVAVADDGSVFVADTGNHRIISVEPDGSVRRTWGDWGRFPGLFAEPAGLEIHDGLLFVADRLNHRIQVFTPEGSPVTWWGMHAVVVRQGEGHIHYPEDIALTAEGDRSVITEPFERRLQIFVPGEPSRPSRSATRAPRGMQSHFDDVLEADGRGLFAWEPEVRSIAAFVTDLETPIHVTTFGSPGTGAGRISSISDLCWDDARQELTVFDQNQLHRWKVTLPDRETISYDPEAAVLLSTSPLPEVAPGRPLQIGGAARGTGGMMHVFDPSIDRVFTLNREGRILRRWPVELDPVAIAANEETVAIADGRTGRVHLFSPEGAAQGILSSPDGRPAGWPGGITILENGDVVTSDRIADRLDVFSADGSWKQSLSGTGTDVGRCWLPGEVAQDALGRIVVLDHGNHRLQAFESEKGWVLTFGLGRSYSPDRLPRRPIP